MHLLSKKLHDKYGPVVRMGPNYLDLDFSSLIKTCFDTQGVWRKVSHLRAKMSRNAGDVNGERNMANTFT